MSATIHDLVSARADRGKQPLHFDTDIEALEHVQAELAQLRKQVAASLLVPADSLERSLARIAAVVDAVGDLYRRDERGTR